MSTLVELIGRRAIIPRPLLSAILLSLSHIYRPRMSLCIESHWSLLLSWRIETDDVDAHYGHVADDHSTSRVMSHSV